MSFKSAVLKAFAAKILRNKYRDLDRRKIKNKMLPDTLIDREDIQRKYISIAMEESRLIDRRRESSFDNNLATPEDQYVLRFLYGCKCYVCGWVEIGDSQENELQSHHIVKRQYGGKTEMNNLVLLCPGCHMDWHKNGEGRFNRIYGKLDKQGFYAWVDKKQGNKFYVKTPC